MKKTAYFALGCFWHPQYEFSKLNGIVKTAVGYMSADSEKSKKYPNPSYKEVCSDKTGYVEVCEVEYNSEKISFEKLMEVFWNIHNPTQLNRQGPDFGTQYKSVIFYYDSEQKKIAEKSLKEEQKKYQEKIVTEILLAKTFHRAEEYHQDYLNKKNLSSCGI